MPTDLDVYAPERWVDDALFRPEVREAYRRLVAQGWTDALRVLRRSSKGLRCNPSACRTSAACNRISGPAPDARSADRGIRQ
jgi:hypothetical protein